MQVHCFTNDQVAVGIESTNKSVSVMIEIALHLKSVPQAKAVVVGIHVNKCATKPFGKHVVATECDLRNHASNCQALPRPFTNCGVVVLTIAPLWIKANCPTTNCTPCNLLCRCLHACGDGNDGFYAIRECDCPFKNLHAAHRTTDNAVPLSNAKHVRETHLRAHHVSNGDYRKPRTIQLAVFRVRCCRASGALTATNHIAAHHEPFVGVDCFARTNNTFPPTRCWITFFGGTSDVTVTCPCVTNQYRI